MEERALGIQARAFKALAHPTRIAILEMMRDGPICSCEIEPELGLRQPNIAQHLAILRNSQLVTSYRDGSRVMYNVIDSRVLEVIDTGFKNQATSKARMYLVVNDNLQYMNALLSSS